MQITTAAPSRNIVQAIAAIMREHPGKSESEIRQIGSFTRRQFDLYAEQAAELAGQQSEARS